MKRVLIMGAALLLAACASEPPDIDVATAVEMGTVDKGVKAEATVTVRNVGGSPLKVLSVSTSCGCTTAEITPTEIPAGGEGTLRIVYDSAVHEADMGDIERFVFIASDDPDEDDVQLTLHVRVAPPGGA